MEINDTPQSDDDRINKVLAPLDDKRQEMKECLSEMRRMFSALKAKVKKYEKIIAALDETKDQTSIMVASNNAQLAMNKFEGIEKRIERCRVAQKYFEEHYKELPKYAKHNDYELTDRIRRTERFHSDFKSEMYHGEDMLRIANKHLKKSDEFLAWVKRLWKGYPRR